MLRPIRLKAWLRTLQGKLIVASLLISLVPTSIAAELAARIVTNVLDQDVQHFLHETSVYFLSNFRTAGSEGTALGRYLLARDEASQDGALEPDQAFIDMAAALGYNVVLVYDQGGHVLYSNVGAKSFSPLFPDVDNTFFTVDLAGRSQVMTGGGLAYEARGRRFGILIGTWLDQDFIENIQSITTLDLRLYIRKQTGYALLYASGGGDDMAMLPADAIGALNEGGESYYDPQSEDGAARTLYMPVKDRDGDVIGILSASLRATELPTVWDLPVSLLVSVCLAGLALTAMAGLFVSRRLSRPLRALARGVSLVGEGDYGHRVAAEGSDEVAELAHVFNKMSEKLGQMHDLEAELRRRDRLSALGEVAVGIAHEVRNPLGTIKTSAELVRARDDIPPADAKLLGYIVDEVRRIDNLIDEFLSFARPRSPILHPLSIASLIERISLFCATELASRAILLSIRDESGQSVIDADEDHLYQACINLVLNAADAMPAGGTLAILVRRQGDELLLSFEDSGMGIEKDLMDKIFDPFFTTKPRGTGLGLAKVFAVMKSHGGRVECQSEPGKGTRFTLILPLRTMTGDHGSDHPARR